MNYKVSEEDLKLIEEVRNFIIKSDPEHRNNNPLARQLFEFSNKLNSCYVDDCKPKEKEYSKLKDLDIATVEAMRDRLLELGVKQTDLVIKRSFELTNKLYPMVHPFYNSKSKPPPTSKTILEEANDIIFKRVEEKQREYGPIDESLEDTAIISSIISNESINIEMVYAVLIGLKVSRMKWNKKHDTFLDGICYVAAFENYIRKKEKQNESI